MSTFRQAARPPLRSLTISDGSGRYLSGALGIVSLIFVLPFLHPHHQAPISTFYQEWVAAVLIVLAAGLMLLSFGSRALPLPESSWLPLMLAGIVGLQVRLDHAASSYHATLYTGYLFLTILGMAMGRSLRDRLGRGRCVYAFAWACTLGALASSLAAVFQLHDIGVEYGLVFPNQGRVTGNLAQANQFTAYLWFGVASGAYLGVMRKLHPAIAVATVCVLLLISFLSGSRGNVVFALALGAMCSVFRYKGLIGSKDYRYLVSGVVFYVVAYLFVPAWLRELGLYSGYTLAERTANELSGSSQRAWIWWLGGQGFLSNPLIGVGIGKLPWFAYTSAPWGPEGYDEYVPEHAHNIFLHLGAELGIAAPVLVAGVMAWWLIALLRRGLESEHLWLLMCLAILFIYANVEYPLWFAYFLLPAAIMMGLSSAPHSPSALALRMAPVAGIMVMALTVGLASMYRDFVKIERVVLQLTFQGVSSHRLFLDEGTKRTLGEVPVWSPLGHYVTFIEMMTAPLERAGESDSVVARCDRVLRMAPGYLSAKKCTMLFALNGEIEKARYHLKQTAAAYPGRQKDLASSLRELAEDEPAVALLAREFEQSIATRMDAKLFGALN